MKKLFLFVSIFISLCLCACSSKSSGPETTPEPDEYKVICSMLSFDEDQTVENYIKSIEKNDEYPNTKYEVYDDDHYVMIMPKDEYHNLVDKMKVDISDELITDDFKDVFSKVEYDDLLQNITYYTTNEAYEKCGLNILGIFITSGVYSDLYQAVNMINPDNRKCTLKVVDSETDEVLYDSSKEENKEDDSSSLIIESYNFVVDSVWNEGLCNVYHYIEDGNDSCGEKIADIKKVMGKLDENMKKLDNYNKSITEINDEKYNDAKKSWDKLYSEAQKLYSKFSKSTPTITGKTVDTSAFSEALSDYSNYLYIE